MHKNNTQKGILISFEGIDGSGKTTQINLLKRYLEEKGYEVLVTREPGGTRISEKIRSVILDPENTAMWEITEMLLYASARAQLVHEVIKPAIESGKIVICDRFIDSSLAYQGYGRQISLDDIIKVNNIALDGIMPSLTFFLDIPPEAALKRRLSSSQPDRIEQESLKFYNKVYEGYLSIVSAYPDRIKSINADRDAESIFQEIKKWTEILMDAHGNVGSK